MPPARLLSADSSQTKIREYALREADNTIGSDPTNAIVIDHQTVSRRHAVIRCRASHFDLVDLNSTNGTFINDRRIITPVVINDHDQIRFGGVRYQFFTSGVAQAPMRAGPSAARAQTPVGARPRRSLKLPIAIIVLFIAGFSLAEYFVNGEIVNRMRAMFAGGAAPQATTSTSEEAPERARQMAESAVPEAESPPTNAPAAESSPSAPEEPPEVRASELGGPQWLVRLNYYRLLAGENPVTENKTLSDGDFKHSRYLLENYLNELKHGENLGPGMHREDPDMPFYTPEGLAAAQHSDVFEGCSPLDMKRTIDGWLAGPFHRLSMLNPSLADAGFGSYRKDGCWTAALDLHMGVRPGALAHPIEFPPDGSSVALEFLDHEWPDPLSACPDYAAPVGLPITLELRPFTDTQLGEHSITRGGEPVEHCAFDASSYTNPDAATEEQGRAVLREFGAIILIPREPLTPGEQYTVSITAQGTPYTWSFTVAGEGGAPSDSGRASNPGGE